MTRSLLQRAIHPDAPVRLEVDHTPNLEWDYHAWYFPYKPEIRLRDTLGRRNGQTTEFIVMLCNNGECSAECIVPATLLEDLAQARFPVPEMRTHDE